MLDTHFDTSLVQFDRTSAEQWPFEVGVYKGGSLKIARFFNFEAA
jgi:hypothetical protein